MATTVVHQSQPYTVAVPAPAVQYHASGPPASERLNTAGAKTGGIIQLTCAGLSVLLGIVAIAIRSCNYYSGSPIWSGVIFYFPAGLLGVSAAKQKSSCPIIGCMVMSILAAIFSVTPFSVNLSGALNEGDYYYCVPYTYGGHYDYLNEDEGAKIAVNSILAVVAAVEFVASIYTSAVMCGGTNCCSTTPRTTVTVVSGQTVPTTTTTQVIQTGYPAGGYQQPMPAQYGQPYQPAPAGYQPPPAGYYPPNAYQSPTAPPPSYSQTDQKM